MRHFKIFFILICLSVSVNAETITNAPELKEYNGKIIYESSASCVRVVDDNGVVTHIGKHSSAGTVTASRNPIIELPLETLPDESADADLPEKIIAIRSALAGMVLASELTDEEISKILAVYEPWEAGKDYVIDDLFTYNNELYKVNQAHKSQSDWIPGDTPALYSLASPAGVIPEWVQPTGAHDAYNTGDKVQFEGHVYESLIDNNVWSPAVYAQGWTDLGLI